MTALIMKGKPAAEVYRLRLTKKIAAAAQKGIKVTLAILTVGRDPASLVYRRRLVKNLEAAGAETWLVDLPAEVSQERVLAAVHMLNEDKTVTGILPLMPLPKQLDAQKICAALEPGKDVDCLHPMNGGLLYLGRSTWGPCTPRACLAILDHYHQELTGKKVVIVGRSNVVGKPLALLMLGRNATVTVCHSRTRDLPSVLRRAEVIVAAVGHPGFITEDMVSEGTVLVDVGINPLPGGGICGDISPQAYAKAGAYTPVPGGVGAVCNMMVLETLTRNLPEEE